MQKDVTDVAALSQLASQHQTTCDQMRPRFEEGLQKQPQILHLVYLHGKGW